MSFFSGLVLGVALGIGLIFAFAYLENVRSKRRSELVSYLLFLFRFDSIRLSDCCLVSLHEKFDSSVNSFFRF